MNHDSADESGPLGAREVDRESTNRVKQRYVCSRCEEWSIIPVDPADSKDSIGYYCPACEAKTDHQPEGATRWF